MNNRMKEELEDQNEQCTSGYPSNKDSNPNILVAILV